MDALRSGETTGQAAALADTPLARGLVAVTRVGLALLWVQNVFWKIPPDFGRARNADLYAFTNDAVTHPVLAPYAWVVEHVVLPNFTVFGWLTLLLESCLGAFILIGLATRFWALVGIGQSLAITLSVLNTPGEWHWSYYLMILGHVGIFAVAAGRAGGLDGVLRPIWVRSSAPLARALVLVS